MTLLSYTSKPFLLRALSDAWESNRNMPLGDWLVARIADYEALETGEAMAISEALATTSLAEMPDLTTMKRDDCKGEFISRFGISGRSYQFRVWPAARQLAGLTKRAKPGAKKSKK
ncbi:hypothetical protein [Bradyrhizobium sp. McL0615]|uniref:hypothetical protein n=1 Tax=Bradyrhizobium sp. McL0615 TaxID=3415673 RepID=UPI003CF613A3